MKFIKYIIDHMTKDRFSRIELICAMISMLIFKIVVDAKLAVEWIAILASMGFGTLVVMFNFFLRRIVLGGQK